MVTSRCSALLIALVAAAASLQAADVPLVEAIKSHDSAAIRAAAKAPGAVNAREVDGTAALHWAARADDLATVQLLLRAGADANVANRYGVTPLSLAATNGNASIVDALLRAGADPNTASHEGQTVLMTAARTGNADAVTLLLARGANPNASEQWLGETALMWAAAHDHAAAVRALADGGADVDARSALSTIPTLRAAGIGLITMEFPKGGWTALMYAAREGANASARALADAGADLNSAGPDGVTPLMLAIINAHYDVALTLLDAGADPNCADQSGMTALYAAVDMRTPVWMQGRPDLPAIGPVGVVDVITALLAHGAAVDARLTAPLVQRNHTAGDTGLGDGATALIRAAKSGDTDLMALLLAHGADAHAELKNHSTGKAYAAVIDIGEGGKPSALLGGGHYEDQYVKTTDGWRIKRREFIPSKTELPPAPQRQGR